MANMLNINTWTVGTGSVTGFAQQTSSLANNRYLGSDPWGVQSVIWESVSIGSSTSNGGFTISPNLSIDISKRYRFSVWQNRTVTGDGVFCFGVWGYTASSTLVYVKNIANSLDDSYFFWNSATPQGEWFLQVGYVHPADYTGTTMMSESGTWRLNGTKYGSARMDMKWVPSQTQMTTQAFLYNSLNVATRQAYIYPRVELCDGTEPSVAQLLRNKRYALGIKTSVGNFGAQCKDVIAN